MMQGWSPVSKEDDRELKTGRVFATTAEIKVKLPISPLQPVTQRNHHIPRLGEKHDSVALSDTITIVTAFVPLDKFQKGDTTVSFVAPSVYYYWMKIFERLNNPLVAFVETDEDVHRFDAIKQKRLRNLTRIVKVSRDELWSFRIRFRVAAIFAQPGYPKHHPNTVYPEYSCVMHAKYELMGLAVHANTFRTKYFSWLDIGYFRSIVNIDTGMLSINLPPQFDQKKVTYNEVFRPIEGLTPDVIFRENAIWLGGGFFVGEAEVMLKWTRLYIAAVRAYLDDGYANTDQQVLYAMRSAGKLHNMVQIFDGYVAAQGSFGIRRDPWFSLGYACLKRANSSEKRMSA